MRVTASLLLASAAGAGAFTGLAPVRRLLTAAPLRPRTAAPLRASVDETLAFVQPLAAIADMGPQQLQHALEAHYAGVFDGTTLTLADAVAAVEDAAEKKGLFGGFFSFMPKVGLLYAICWQASLL